MHVCHIHNIMYFMIVVKLNMVLLVLIITKNQHHTHIHEYKNAHNITVSAY